ncbi:carbon-nitrogen hydrolase family protein [Allosediminivita pacifica]|uniref:Nitrilase n=1 Tax=Allosediminivita pacifica TaxID=1267769 RepID=A0A2T6A4C0_9RHOB|nr:carbon-nitrogen hydrolase family protein [Allosediminivita pacifica]PTX38664.1 nitrilase [Allosediminivita pacifica]GGB28961.1 nitrilase [Allosediminivita pacifica]
MPVIKAAVVQKGARGSDTGATLEEALATIAECGSEGAKLVVFPEAYLGGYPKGADFKVAIGHRTPEGREEFNLYAKAAIEVPGAETRAISEAAQAAGCFVTIGVIERDGGTIYCTALYFGPEGALLGKHRKLMPTASERLCWGFGDGSTLDTVETPWGRMGAVICWENYMPMMRMAMYDQDISFYCAPTADDRDSWAATMRHVALEGRCFVLSACQYLTGADFPQGMGNVLGSEDDRVLMRGGSMIIDPLGQVLAGPVFDAETILYADLDTDQINRGKFDFDVAGHYARPDVFHLSVDDTPRPPATRASTLPSAGRRFSND